MDPWDAWRETLSEQVERGLAVLWGKSGERQQGPPNLLAQHLLDTLAVGELLWDRYLAPKVRDEVDEITGGRGREFFSWLCGAHDLGKATPAFQRQVVDLARRVRDAGLPFDRQGMGRDPHRAWRHERASGRILIDAAEDVGWHESSREWVWPLLAGHHGLFPSLGEIDPPRPPQHGEGSGWRAVQRSLLDMVTAVAGYGSLAEVEPSGVPGRPLQLALSGFVIMADWIASDETHFGGIADWDAVTPHEARDRAVDAWDALGLRGGWGRLPDPPADPVAERFGVRPRAGQAAVVEAARSMPSPGLLIVEAPTGEGKTEAALAAAEVLAARSGADGVLVGMPTQATADPMLTRVGAWAKQVRPGMQIALLHGKRRFNPQWRHLMEGAADGSPAIDADADEHGVRDDYASASGLGEMDLGGEMADESLRAAVEWLHGAKRGLLSPLVVGTIDQLLFAATRTKHVALRFAGLIGKVVVLDEVHAADVYMEQFLLEALWWLGEAGVPVVLLSATLTPRQRRALATEYLRGAARDNKLACELPRPGGYPSVTSVCWLDGEPRCAVSHSDSWRSGNAVRVDVLDEEDGDEGDAVVACLREALTDGGCALVLRNTVQRAQDTYRLLRDQFDGEAVLLHGRLSAADRADRTEALLAQLGPPGAGGGPRPARLVVVATQVAEQSFDVDVDLLVTDLAPIDLLLQRAGRLHRHDRPPGQRPGRVSQPRVVVTGIRRRDDGPPVIAEGSLAVYGQADHALSRSGSGRIDTPYRAAAPLLRTARLVVAVADGTGWVLPDDVPQLVAEAYDGAAPLGAPWSDVERAEWEAFTQLQELRAGRARQSRLARQGHRTAETLAGIHGGGEAGKDEDAMAAAVRDGVRGPEVVLVTRVGERYRTLSGEDLGFGGERIRHEGVPDALLGGTVRLPVRHGLAESAERLGPCLPELRDHPWTAYAHVLVLESGEAELGGYQVRYDRELGLTVERP